MGKITVKHYLNTNLKPYMVNKEKYYSIYILVTVNRQNTKIKSSCFTEYYTEKDFDDIVNEEDGLLKRECSAIENFVRVLVDIFGGDFDTGIFSTMYSLLSNLFIFDVEYLGENIKYFSEKDGVRNVLNLYEKNKNKLGIEIDRFMISSVSMKENTTKGMSLISYFSDTGQNNLRNFLLNAKCKIDIDEAINVLNDIVMYDCLQKLQWVLKSNRKSDLYHKYQNMFDCEFELGVQDYAKKYGVPINE